MRACGLVVSMPNVDGSFLWTIAHERAKVDSDWTCLLVNVAYCSSVADHVLIKNPANSGYHCSVAKNLVFF